MFSLVTCNGEGKKYNKDEQSDVDLSNRSSYISYLLMVNIVT